MGSAWVDLTSATALARLIVWDSGEAELSAGSLDGPISPDPHLAAPRAETGHRLESARDLETAVSRLLRLVIEPFPES
jgi:hypothetical protein